MRASLANARLGRIAFGGLILAVAGCTSLAMKGADPSALRSATLAEACPLGVSGTRVQVVRPSAAARDGVSVVFSTRPPNVAEIRERARDQAKVNGPNRHLGRGHLGEHQGARDHGLRLWALPPVRTAVTDTPNGAELSVVAIDPARADEVVDAITARAAKLGSTDCY